MTREPGNKLLKVTRPKRKANLLVNPSEQNRPVCRQPLAQSGNR
jgi:hypothetical protein